MSFGMTERSLKETAPRLVAADEGLLALDETPSTRNRRFAERGIFQSGEARGAYREMIITAPGRSESIRGVILHDFGIILGIAFLSGARSAELAVARLNPMNTRSRSRVPLESGFFCWAVDSAARLGNSPG